MRREGRGNMRREGGQHEEGGEGNMRREGRGNMRRGTHIGLKSRGYKYRRKRKGLQSH